MLKWKLLTAAAVALTLSFGTAASVAVAQQPDKQTGKPDTGMMGGHQPGTTGSPGEMMGKGGMMPMMGQMNRMMENCNRMMEGMMQNMPNTPEKKG